MNKYIKFFIWREKSAKYILPPESQTLCEKEWQKISGDTYRQVYAMD